MIRRFRPLFLVATLCAALIAGCGGSSNNNTNTNSTSSSSSSSSSSTSSTTSAAKTSASSTTSHTTHSGSTTSAAKTTPAIPGNLGALNTAAVAAYCNTALSAATTLSSSDKAKFRAYCAALGHDNPTQLKAAEKTLCLQILGSVPAAYRSIAKAECSKL
jgi:hypothetical protein